MISLRKSDYPLVMFNQIIEMLSLPAWRTDSWKAEQLQVAVAALLVQAAAMDDHFDPEERATIERLLAIGFKLDADQVRAVLATAEDAAARSNQLYAFTRVVVERMEADARIGLVEMLWEVALSDGLLSPDEDALIRRIAGLIYVSDHDRGAARKRVLQRRCIAGRKPENQKE